MRPRAELLAVAVLGQVGLAAEDLGPLLHRFVKRQVLEGVERVVMDEDRDRPLRRQEVGRVLDHSIEMEQAMTMFLRLGPRGCSGRGSAHGDWGNPSWLGPS